MPRTTTMADVARRAGVTKATVSYALSGTRRNSAVAGATRRRILSIARRMGYQPRHSARSLATRRTRCLGLVLPGNVGSALLARYCSVSIPALERECRRRGYALMVSVENLSDAGTFEMPANVGQRRVDGYFFVHADDLAIVRQFARFDLPCICLGHDPNIGKLIPTVEGDLMKGWLQAIRYAAKLGHRRVDLILPTMIRSEMDFARELRDHARRDDDAATRACDVRVFAPHLSTSWADLDQLDVRPLWLATPRRRRATLIVGPERLMLRAIRSLHESGMRCPRDLSLICYGDSGLAELGVPPLTCIAMDTPAQFRTAVDLLVDHLEQIRPLGASASRADIRCWLEVRGSCTPPHA